MSQPLSELLGNKSSYADKLRDPRWENRRMWFVRKHGAWCRSCKRKGIEFQVHHKVYRKGVEPWDHTDDEMILLCRGCHLEWHQALQEFRGAVIGSIPVSSAKIIIRALGILLRFNRPESVGYALAQLACEQNTVAHLSTRYQAEDKKHGK